MKTIERNAPLCLCSNPLFFRQNNLEIPNYQKGSETTDKEGIGEFEPLLEVALLGKTSLVWPYHQEAGFACTCHVMLFGRKMALQSGQGLGLQHVRESLRVDRGEEE